MGGAAHFGPQTAVFTVKTPPILAVLRFCMGRLAPLRAWWGFFLKNPVSTGQNRHQAYFVTKSEVRSHYVVSVRQIEPSVKSTNPPTN
jgi:hypothetical protein